MKTKFLILLSLFRYFPLILFRYLKYLILKKHHIVNEFRPDSSFCIDGSLNQLMWSVDNCLFMILDGSPKVYLGDSSHIFNVSNDITEFSLKSYGYDKVIKSKANIQVVTLKQKSFESNILTHTVTNIRKQSIELNHPKNVHIAINRVNALSSLRPKHLYLPNKIKGVPLIPLNGPNKELEYINNYQNIEQLNSHHYD